MFVILTSRPGQYRTELCDGLRLCESYDYLFCGQVTVHFDIAVLLHDLKLRVVDEAPPERVNTIPSKLLPKFASLDAARAELHSLAGVSGIDVALRRLP